MTDILGHDIDGRPLRAGDKVVILNSGATGRKHDGAVCSVIGRCPIHPSIAVEISIPYYGSRYKWWSSSPKNLRKLNTDHRPATESFSEMMNNLNKVTA